MSIQLLLGMHSLAQQGDPNAMHGYALEPIYLPTETRPACEISASELGTIGFGGDLPRVDGDQFQLNFQVGQHISLEEAKNRTIDFMQFRQVGGKMNPELQFKSCAESLSKPKVPNAPNNGNLCLQECFSGVPIESAKLVMSRAGPSALLSIRGRYFESIQVTNTNSKSYKDAISMAGPSLQRFASNQKLEFEPDGELVLLPYQDGFRYAWRTLLTVDGRYQVWIDAQTAAVLQLLPVFQMDPGKGCLDDARVRGICSLHLMALPEYFLESKYSPSITVNSC